MPYRQLPVLGQRLEDQSNHHPPTPSQSPPPSVNDRQQAEDRQDLANRVPQANNAHANANAGSASLKNVAIFTQVIKVILAKSPHSLPASPTDIVTSNQIDRFAHAMWSVCLQNGQLLNHANTYASMMNEVKLRALAKLNFLPSWWFLRDHFLSWLEATGRPVDDSIMRAHWKFAVGDVSAFMQRANRVKMRDQGVESIAQLKAEQENEDPSS